MKTVKSNSFSGSTCKKSINTTQEINMKKLNQVDFKNLDSDTTEQFRELRKDIEGLARRLSLTSGSVPGANHLQVNGSVLKDLNTRRESEECNNNKNNRCRKPCLPDDKEVNQVLSSLPQSLRRIVNDYVIQSVLYHTDRKVHDLLLHIMDKYQARSAGKVEPND